MLKKIFQDKYFYIIAIIAIVFVIIKIPHLSLPYYWDEAFGYSVAVRYMYDHGLSLLPNAINPYLSVGHPILFHFFEASWMKIFGTSLVAAKSFPLTISVLLIFSIYYFCKKFFNRIIGVASIIIFCSQEIFIAQASFVLLEVMLTFFTITTLYFYFSRKQDNSAVSYYDLLYILSALLLSLTKESGMILIMVLVLWQFIELITDKEKRIFKSSLKEFIILISPLILVSAYYIAQKITYGWFFYPLHIELMSNKWTTLHFELSDIYSPILYQKFGRIIMTIASAIALVFYFITKNKPEKIQIKIIIVFALFLIFFQFYSSVNFFSTRYILCEFPVYIIICSYFIFTAFRQYKPLAVAITITIIAVKLYSTYTERNDADSNLGFVDAVTVQKKMVNYCEQNHLQDKIIYAHFLMAIDLINPIPGYLSNKNNPFKHVSADEKNINNTEYFIFSSTEYDPKYEKFKSQYNLKLIKRFQKYNSWSELYRAYKVQL